MKRSDKKIIINLIIMAILTFILVALIVVSRADTHFAEMYALYVYPVLQAVISRLTGIFPFSLYELLIICGIIYLLYLIIRTIYLTVKKQGKKIGRLYLHTLMILYSIIFIFVCNCGVNYHRLPFSSYSGLKVEKTSPELLEEVCIDMINRANALVPYIDTIETEAGAIFSLAKTDTNKEAVIAMNNLGRQYSVLKGYYPKAKPVLFSKVMSYMYITGVYSAFTIEANYNNDVPDTTKAYTICHELSHLRGFMREDEAGFIAYLACMNSENINMQYSGIVNALTYVMNSYYKEFGAKKYSEIYRMMDEQIIRDFRNENEYWDHFDTKVAEVADTVNNVYLQANAQEDGVKSYGRMVDLVIAYYRKCHE